MSKTNVPAAKIISDPSHMLPEHTVEAAFYAPFEGEKWFDEATRLGLDPVIGAVAASPRKLNNQAHAAFMRVLGEDLYQKINEAYGRADDLDPRRVAMSETLNTLSHDARDELDRHITTGSIVGALVGASLAAYGFNEIMLDGADDAYRSLGSNPTTKDPSIFPGDWGTVDIFGQRLGIPGFRDVPGSHKEIVKEVTTIEAIDKDSLEVSANVEVGENDPALDLELTGREYQQDVIAAQALIDQILSEGKDHKITSIEITGIASDELFSSGSDGVGTTNQENIYLAEQRAAIGAVAFEDVAEKSGIEVPEFRLASYEDILSIEEVGQLDELAFYLGVDRSELIKSFNRDPSSFSEEVSTALQKLLPRGVNYAVTYERTFSTSESVEKVIEVKSDSVTAGLPSEALALPSMISGAAVGSLLLMSRISKMLAKHSARKEIRKARKSNN